MKQVLILIIIMTIIMTILNLRKKVAIAMPPFFTWIRKDYRNNTEVIRHEECHWEQYRRMGFIKFYKQYFSEQLNGYANSSLEKECYEAEMKN